MPRERGIDQRLVAAINIIHRIEHAVRLADIEENRRRTGWRRNVDQQRRLILRQLLDTRQSQMPDRKSTRLNSSHKCATRMPSSACKTTIDHLPKKQNNRI